MLQKITSKLDIFKTLFAIIPLLLMAIEVLQFAQQKYAEYQAKNPVPAPPATYRKSHESKEL